MGHKTRDVHACMHTWEQKRMKNTNRTNCIQTNVARPPKQACAHALKHAPTQAYTPTSKHAHKHARMHTRTHAHTHAQTQAHTSYKCIITCFGMPSLSIVRTYSMRYAARQHTSRQRAAQQHAARQHTCGNPETPPQANT